MVIQILNRLSEALDGANLAPDVEKQVKTLLQSALSKMDLVSREEFDAQAAVLAKTRIQIEALQQQLDDLLKNST